MGWFILGVIVGSLIAGVAAMGVEPAKERGSTLAYCAAVYLIVALVLCAVYGAWHLIRNGIQ